MKKKYFSDEERKEAIKIRNRRAYEKNKLYHQEYSKTHKDIRKEYHKTWYALKHPKKEDISNEELNIARKLRKSQYQKQRKANDPLYKLKCNLRTMICNLITSRGFTKKSNTQKIVGCSFDSFKRHLESKFEPWMNWNNYGLYNGTECYGWDIDHIIPLASVTTEDDIVKLNHYSNLQPLCSYRNRVIKRSALSVN